MRNKKWIAQNNVPRIETDIDEERRERIEDGVKKRVGDGGYRQRLKDRERTNTGRERENKP